ncbi:hypothetical protein M569_02116, partial [Genlisea aurea]
SVGATAVLRRKEMAVTAAKERREALMRAKRLCRVAVGSDDQPISDNDDIVMDEEPSILEIKALEAVEALKQAVAYRGKGEIQKRVNGLRCLRKILSKSEYPPVEAVLSAGGMPPLVQCLSFGSNNEQLLEAAWCFTNMAAGNLYEVDPFLPALPLLIAHIGDKSSIHVAEQCAWALGNLAAEGKEMRNIMLSQGALLPLAKMVLANKGSAVRTAAWALSNLLKGRDPAAAAKLIKVDGIVDGILHHLASRDEELATEIGWVVVYLTALSDLATTLLGRSSLPDVLVKRLMSSNSTSLLIPILRSLGNLVAGDPYVANTVFAPGNEITVNAVEAITKCLKFENHALQKESAWVLSNLAAGSLDHKRLIHSSVEAMDSLIVLLSAAPFDVRKEAAYVLGNICVVSDERANVIIEHLISIVGRGCLSGFVNLVRSPDTEAAMMGLQFMELVLREMPDLEGVKIVEDLDGGIEAVERFQFHENEVLRNMANELADKYF